MNKRAKIKREAFAREYITNGFNATEAIKTVSPKLDGHVANVCGSRLLAHADTQEVIAHELAETMGVQEVKQRISELARNSKSDAHKLKALELMARVHALLVERQEQSIRQVHELPADVEKMTKEELLGLLMERLKLSAQGVEMQEVVERDDSRG